MDSTRTYPPDSVPLWVPCCRCSAAAKGWDRIVGKPYCPNCEEALATGEGPPFVERTEKNRCTVCNCAGTVRFLTFPLNMAVAVEMDLCPEHLRGLLGRRLGAHAFAQLRRRLHAVGVDVGNVFLLHDAFYDAHGRALQPAIEPS